jgi:hypothetical protein
MAFFSASADSVAATCACPPVSDREDFRGLLPDLKVTFSTSHEPSL